MLSLFRGSRRLCQTPGEVAFLPFEAHAAACEIPFNNTHVVTPCTCCRTLLTLLLGASASNPMGSMTVIGLQKAGIITKCLNLKNYHDDTPVFKSPAGCGHRRITGQLNSMVVLRSLRQMDPSLWCQ